MAARRGVLPIGHPTHVHVMQCSPCYQRLEGYRASYRWRRTFAAAAAVLLVLAAGYGAYQQWPWARNLIARNQPEIGDAVVDLRPFTAERSDRPPGNTRQPPRLPGSQLRTVFYLPVGIEPGSYQLRILDSDLKARVNTTATAKLENFETTIQTTIDLRALPPGKYTIVIRRAGDDWHQFPLLIDSAR
jgi:hypothetical protein